MLRELLASHPGLSFCRAAAVPGPVPGDGDVPDLRRRTRRGLRSSLAPSFEARATWRAMRVADEEEDINKCLRYFSYEHFYVMYCKFWELDTDHDFLIDKEDLLRYGNHALTYRAVRPRVFAGAARARSGVPGKMGYEDFCWFVLAEEDKSNPLALEYWFSGGRPGRRRRAARARVRVFLRGAAAHGVPEPGAGAVGGRAVPDERHATSGAPPRITSGPAPMQVGGQLFNVLFNLNKFIAFESRDPFSIGASARSRTSRSGTASRAPSTCGCPWRRRRARRGHGWDGTAATDGSSF